VVYAPSLAFPTGRDNPPVEGTPDTAFDGRSLANLSQSARRRSPSLTPAGLFLGPPGSR